MRRVSALLSVLVLLSVVAGIADAQNPDTPKLELRFRTGNGVYSPQEPIIIDVAVLAAQQEMSDNLNVVLVPVASDSANSNTTTKPIAELETRIIPHSSVPVSFIAPAEEGIYEIVATLQTKPEPNRFPNPLHALQRTGNHPPKMEIRRQCIVIEQTRQPRSIGDVTLSAKSDILTDILNNTDPAPLSRWQKFSFPKIGELPKLPSLHRKEPEVHRSEISGLSGGIAELHEQWSANPAGRWGNGHFKQESVQNPAFAALTPSEIGDSWEALPIPVQETEKPYLVEIDYPLDIPQTLAISIVELSASGCSITKSDTLHVGTELVQERPQGTATHRILFWAKTKQPILMLANRQQHREALFSNIRVSQVTSQEIPKPFEGTSQRKLIGHLQRTDFLPNVPMTQPVTLPTALQTAYEGCNRLINSLQKSGYDGVTITVLSKETKLYPAAQFDGHSTDSLEILFRLFDREQLTLIPAINFNLPIPSLEQLLQQNPALTDELLIDGGMEPRRYNLLHPLVQDAMTGIVRELVERSVQHPSFGGVAVLLTADGYAQLPFALRAPDDRTFWQFRQEIEKELGISFPDEQRLQNSLPTQQFHVQKNSQRIRFLQNPKVWEAWVRWRTLKVRDFYARLAKGTASQRKEIKLYLSGGTMFDLQEIKQFCSPSLPQNCTPIQAIRLLGFDLNLLAEIQPLVFLRPSRISETENHCYRELDSADAAAYFSRDGVVPGTLFYHDTGTIPAEYQNRKRFVKQLAQSEVMTFFDGGESLPTGEESGLFDLLAAYRQLPPVPFTTYRLPEPQQKEELPNKEQHKERQTKTEVPQSLQPLTIRYLNTPDGLIVYLVNDVPFEVEADLMFVAAAKTTLTDLSGRRMIRSFFNGSWRVSLQPFDLLAVKLDDPNASICSVNVIRPTAICGETGILKQKVNELGQRLHAARAGITWEKLDNPNFEITTGGNEPFGWERFGNQNFSAKQDREIHYGGEGSLKLTNTGTESGTVLSKAFEAPASGRLWVSAFIGIPSNADSLPLNVMLVAEKDGEPFNQSAPIGATLLPLLANVEPVNGVRWHRVVVPFDQLPQDSLNNFRIGFQWSGGSCPAIWVDEVTLYQVSFSPGEVVELQKLLIAADRRFSQDRISDLLSILESYWSQFLFEHVPAPIPQPVEVKPAEKIGGVVTTGGIASGSSGEPKATMYDRFKGWFTKKPK